MKAQLRNPKAEDRRSRMQHSQQLPTASRTGSWVSRVAALLAAVTFLMVCGSLPVSAQGKCPRATVQQYEAQFWNEVCTVGTASFGNFSISTLSTINAANIMVTPKSTVLLGIEIDTLTFTGFNGQPVGFLGLFYEVTAARGNSIPRVSIEMKGIAAGANDFKAETSFTRVFDGGNIDSVTVYAQNAVSSSKYSSSTLGAGVNNPNPLYVHSEFTPALPAGITSVLVGFDNR